jgi:hypothetical protein
VGGFSGVPKAARDSPSTIEQLTGEECEEAMSMMNHSSHEALVMDKRKATFKHRQILVRDQDKAVDVLETFPRFLHIPGLVSLHSL